MSHAQPNTYHFDFNSASNTTHVIAHNLGDLQPLIEVIRDDTNTRIIPEEILIVDQDTVAFTFFIARAVRGKITHGSIIFP